MIACARRGDFPPRSSHRARRPPRIASLYWIFFWISTAVYVAGPPRARRGARAPPRGRPGPVRPRLVAWARRGDPSTTLVLFALLVMSLRTGRENSIAPAPSNLVVEVVGRQWWWEIRYPGAGPAERIVTANELHVPVGRTVQLKLASGDVIHSFWVPALNGKTDLIPGRHATQMLRADRPGVFHGRCAEFCGYQHAHMGLLVIAEPPAAFERWLGGQRQPSQAPASETRSAAARSSSPPPA